jgi:hypothetical protein
MEYTIIPRDIFKVLLFGDNGKLLAEFLRMLPLCSVKLIEYVNTVSRTTRASIVSYGEL